MPSHLSLEHAHFGYLLYLAKKHHTTIDNLSNDKLPETFTDENLENWCHDYYRTLQYRITASEKLYLAKLLPKNDRLNLALNYLSNLQALGDDSIAFKSDQDPIENPLAMLSLCFKLNDQELLQHLFELCRMETSSQRTILNEFFSPMIYLYNHAQKETLETAYKDFITQMYYFKQNPDACVKENLISAWKEINTCYEQGNALEAKEAKERIRNTVGRINIGTSMTMLIIMPFVIILPLANFVVPAILLTLMVLTFCLGIYILATAEQFDYESSCRHEYIKRAYPTLTRFMSEADNSNHDDSVTAKQPPELNQKLI